jgi:hypothetical protein
MISKNIFADKFGEILALFAQTGATFCKNMIITLVFEKNATFSTAKYQLQRQNSSRLERFSR